MLTLLIFLVVLSVLVLVHELGHFVAAKICGVKAEEFGYGFPPRAVGLVKEGGKWKKVGPKDRKEYRNTVWSLNWLPLGGFVRLKGEQGEDGHSPDSFLAKSIPRRLFILVAGVAMNWLVAAMIFTVGFIIGVPAQLEGIPASALVRDAHIEITEVMPKSAADVAGLKPGDRLVSVDSQVVANMSAARDSLAERAKSEEQLTLGIKRGDTSLMVKAKPLYVAELGRAGLGVGLADVGTVRFVWYRALVQGFAVTAQYTKLVVYGFGGLLRDLFVNHKVTEGLSGPVGIAVMTGQVAQRGFWPVLEFMALLSLNLAVINFLPVPALDGGRAIFIFVEALRRKRADPKFEAIIHQIGFLVLIVLILLITVRDVKQYSGVLWNGLKNLSGF